MYASTTNIPADLRATRPHRGLMVILSAVLLLADGTASAWPYLTKKQFIEGNWRREPRITVQYAPGFFSETREMGPPLPHTFKDGLITIGFRVYADYAFVNGWTIRFKPRTSETRAEVIFTIEKVDDNTMKWWHSDVSGKRLAETPYFTWHRVAK